MIYAIAILSAFFLFAAFLKITGKPEKVFEIQMEMIESYGVSRGQFRLIGIVEGIGAVLVWFTGSVLGPIGAGMLSATSLGAIFFHLKFDTWKQGVPAMITFVLSTFVWVSQGDKLLAFLGAG
ncbi:DoxX family protein [Alisedimentitalea sp. MJ-SS2]|uniref:DoxX family protein n=1 Tax=Aliisedimentitalea sp. MJ-SS2 TaxID=3049795 RepID=UPI00290C9258|nr:DoxX family protein [Alisedimentitalea sp. MJ-SS2]MDU8928838.1 DoxX family protein [Alisedimentitalea sp. MJ-SS2]